MILLRGPQRGNYNIYVSLFFRTRTYYYCYKKKLVPTCAYAAAATTAPDCGKRRRPRRRRLDSRTYCLIFLYLFHRIPLIYYFSFICKSFWRRPKEFIINSPDLHGVCLWTSRNINNIYYYGYQILYIILCISADYCTPLYASFIINYYMA